MKDFENDTKVIPPAPFKVGDKVRRFVEFVSPNIEMSGAICEIEDVKWSDENICWYLRLNGNSGYVADYYQLVESAQPQEDKFKELKEAFSKGAIIEVKNYFKDEWREVSNPEWNPNLEYRVKPEEKEKDVIRFRVALFKDTDDRWTSSTYDDFTASYWEEDIRFVQWLTDWVEVKV